MLILTSVSNPISPTSLAGVGERMIIIPELTHMPKSRIPTLARRSGGKSLGNRGCCNSYPFAFGCGPVG